MNTTPRKPRQRRPHERSVKVLITAFRDTPALVRITQDGVPSHYWVSPQPSNFGLYYRFERTGEELEHATAESYDVLLENEQDASCTCPGHVYGNYCKHLDALRALLSKGLLPLPSVQPLADPEWKSGQHAGEIGF